MAFMGETTEVGIADLLSVLARRGHTGRLTISVDQDDTQIYLDGGKIALVSSSRRELRLGRVLVRLGTIDEGQLGTAVRQQDRDGAGRALGQILTESGQIAPEDLVRAAEEQCIESLARVMVASRGSFTFNRDFRPAFRDGLLSLNAEGIVLESSRRADEMMRLRGLLPPAGARIALTPRALVQAPQLSVAESLIVGAIRRTPMTIPQLAEELPVEEVALWRAIVRLRERGLIYALIDANSAPFEPPSPEAHRTVPDVLRLCAAGPRTASLPVPTLDDIRQAGQASDEIAAALAQVVRAAIDERNERRILGALSHYTDDFLRRSGMLETSEVAALRTMGPPLPESEHKRLLDLRDARLLSDGRASAIAIVGGPDGQEFRTIMIFAPHEGGWLIDADLG